MLDLSALNKSNRLLFSVPLRPVQGDRFQPTGFPSLGAATYQTKDGQKLLVESAQSMANRLETTCWDASNNRPIASLSGISHITVNRNGRFLTDSMLEAHRINSPYILNSSDRSFLDPFLAMLRTQLGDDLVNENNGLINRNGLASTLVRYDIGSLIHGVFLSNKVKLNASDKTPESIGGGRLRVTRALSGFIEASNVRVAPSGGVKNDHVNPSGVTKDGFGNVPFARDEFVGDLVCHINLDLAQIRGYGLNESAEKLLVLLALHRVRRLFEGDLRLRAACDLEPITRDDIVATRSDGFPLPSLVELEGTENQLGFVQEAIAECGDMMTHSITNYTEPFKKGKDGDSEEADDESESEEPSDE